MRAIIPPRDCATILRMGTRLDSIKGLANNPRLVDGDNRKAIENLRKAVLGIVEELKRHERKHLSPMAPGAVRVRSVQK